MKQNHLNFSETHLKAIYDANRNGKLAFFVGAGFSKFCETEFVKIPNWAELILELKKDLNLESENDFLKIAQMYYLEFGEYQYTKKIKSVFPNDMEPSKFHELLFDLYPKCVITTNWDDLLEKTVKKKTLIYDVIKSDADLVRSLFDRKIIKMHGDFDQQNFVFKEDDYLQYNQKFSLIENYIKGVFTTHTIVFLGYSYSDIDLKMILKWIDNSSKVSPPRYLLSNKPSSAQEKYLLNHNIFVLSPKEELGYQDLYNNFFNDLNLYNSPDEMIKRIVSKSNNKGSLDSSLVKLINEKFYYLRQYRSLIPTQIQNKFGNCSVKPCGTGVILSFHDVYLTYDYDKDIRIFYKNYISYLFNEQGDQNIGWFLDVLVKSGIYYISIDDNHPRLIQEAKSFNYNTIENYKNNHKLLFDLFQFNFTKDDWAFLLYEEKYEAILKKLLYKINFYIKNKNYIMATIYMANHDLICENIKMLSISKKDESVDKLILNYPKFNWKLKVKDFPDDMQKDLEFLIDFIDLKEVYKLFYSLQVILDKKIESATTRANGGISFSRDEDKFKQTLNSTLKFLLLNDIFIDLYIEVKDLFSKSLEKYITFQLIEKNVNLDQIDFYILIKYFSEKKLKKLRSSFLNENATELITFRSSIDQVNVKLYLLKSFLNLAKNLSLSKKDSIYKGDFEIWLDNIICLLPMFNWSEKRLDQIFDQILNLLTEITQSYTIYENIMQFIVLNFKLYKKSTKKILVIFDIFMSKLMMGKFNGFDSGVVDSNILPKICYVISEMGYKYENELILRKLVAYYSDESEDVKRFIIDKLFLSLYVIGSDSVKGVIFDFIILNSPNCLNKPEDFIYELKLISYDFPIREGFVDQLNNFIDTHIPNSLSHLDFIKAGIEEHMLYLLDYIVNNRNNKELESCLNNFNEKIKLIKE
ncbi:SIR2 family protein [Acinetobacter ursingii]|uniref:SIR2 family protein n=1 Tax=Acinetobacter ursingii TaxID=108980 RepID=UPI0021CDB385|nr:SIR2 family protein [Acinetobacter ursingii]MCU4483216.1 SIR2 family protein [Acinetobacter ursingii]MCU4507536.1 SIR2 family protein [Acinetobacter ursingii]MCU4571339.1 SIR2 family protein [Acinetobacter ursingii]